MAMEYLALGGIFVAGIFAGTINTIAGGGSLIGIAALIFFGLPANVANATNRVGVLVQSTIATAQFYREGMLHPRQSASLVVPTCLGALCGSLVSVDIDEQLLRRVIGVAMMVMLVVMLAQPKRWLTKGNDVEVKSGWLTALGFFGLGFYGGFLQAGVGIFLLAALVLLAGRSLAQANGVKVFLVAIFTAPAIAVYIYTDLISWVPGIGLALGSGIGGWLGTKLTMSWGPKFVRAVLFAVILVSGTHLLGLW